MFLLKNLTFIVAQTVEVKMKIVAKPISTSTETLHKMDPKVAGFPRQKSPEIGKVFEFVHKYLGTLG